MSLQDSPFSEDIADDVSIFVQNKTRKRVLIFPPVNNFHRYIIHQLVQERFSTLLHTFSIGQGSARRTVVCYKNDMKRDWNSKLNTLEWKTDPVTKQIDATQKMGIEDQQLSSTSPEQTPLQRQTKLMPTVEIYRPPAARRANTYSSLNETQIQLQSTTNSFSVKNTRQKRPDRAVYVPRHRRSLEINEKKSQLLKSHLNNAMINEDPNTNNNSKLQDVCCIQQSMDSLSSDNEICDIYDRKIEDNQSPQEILKSITLNSKKISNYETNSNTNYISKLSEELKQDVPILSEQKEKVAVINLNGDIDFDLKLLKSDKSEINDKRIATTQPMREENKAIIEHLNDNNIINYNNKQSIEQNAVSDVLIISNTVENKSKHSEQVPEVLQILPEKKMKKIKRQKSKPAQPSTSDLKINRDECDWDSLFDDNGDCLDPTLIEELTSAVGEVTIERPKNDYKTYSKQVQVSSDEFAHVVEIYNFPSEFKTSDLAAVFSPFRNGGFELKWVDDTHCLGVFSSPLIAAEVLASNHPFVKTRPLSEATALSKTKARRSAEFLQPYRNRPETCAALARRLVTGALGMKLATARQERELEKNILREAKEKKRLANKQREDIWEGIIPGK